MRRRCCAGGRRPYRAACADGAARTRARRRWSTISAYEEPEAWVRTVAFRISVNSWHKAKNRLTAHLRTSRHDEKSELSPDMVTLISALRKIRDARRRVIVLYHLVDLSIEQIAKETGTPAGTVKARLARGRKALAPLVSEFPEDEVQQRSRAADQPRRAAARHLPQSDQEAATHA